MISAELTHKHGEWVWRLTVLANRKGIDISESVEFLLTTTENLLGE